MSPRLHHELWPAERINLCRISSHPVKKGMPSELDRCRFLLPATRALCPVIMRPGHIACIDRAAMSINGTNEVVAMAHTIKETSDAENGINLAQIW